MPWWRAHSSVPNKRHSQPTSLHGLRTIGNNHTFISRLNRGEPEPLSPLHMTSDSAPSPRTKRSLRWGIGAALVTTFLAKPAFHAVHALRKSSGTLPDTPAGYAQDASRLNLTHVERVWEIPEDPQEAEHQLAEILQLARQKNRSISIAGARHSMGGHTLAPGGIVVDMRRFNRMQLNSTGDLLHVQSGARWDAIIPYLDKYGRSVAVMQSDNSFSVGGSVSVNCHGWQFDRPPIASTVESFRLMKADGTVVRCSRDENAELFSLALGGFGLFGVILDLELRVVSNARYRMEQSRVPAAQALETYSRHVREKEGVEMVYARLNIRPESLFDEVLLTAFFREEGNVPRLAQPELAEVQRLVFRGSAGSDYGKKVRWLAETRIHPLVSSHVFSRNSLLNASAQTLQNRSGSSTDILHEYFIPEANVPEFVHRLRQILPRSGCDLLNVTVRSVNEDRDTLLRYADQTLIAFVMLFEQRISSDAEERMETLTQSLIETALHCKGRYYLPYRLHATREQFARAYPQAPRFFELKRRYDPQEIFQNLFYQKYAIR